MDAEITEEMVTAAIAVLKAYKDGTLRTDQCDELDEALTGAYYVWEDNVRLAMLTDPEYEEPSESPLTSSW